MLSHSDGRQIEMDSHVAGDSEEGRVQSSVSVHHQHVGSVRKSIHCGLDSGKLSIGEVRGNVRELNASSNQGDLERAKILKGDRRRRDMHLLSAIGDVDAGDDFNSIAIIAFYYLRRKPLLLLAERTKELDRRQRIDDSQGIRATGEESDAFLRQMPGSGFNDRSTIGADHPIASWRLGMLHEPGGHGASCTNITQCPGDCAASCDATPRNFVYATRERFREAHFHIPGRDSLPQNLSTDSASAFHEISPAPRRASRHAKRSTQGPVE